MVALCRCEKQANLKGLFAEARDVMPSHDRNSRWRDGNVADSSCAAASDINVAQQLERMGELAVGFSCL